MTGARMEFLLSKRSSYSHQERLRQLGVSTSGSPRGVGSEISYAQAPTAYGAIQPCRADGSSIPAQHFLCRGQTGLHSVQSMIGLSLLRQLISGSPMLPERGSWEAAPTKGDRRGTAMKLSFARIFEQNRWVSQDGISKREYASYRDYVIHQKAKLPKIHNLAKKREVL